MARTKTEVKKASEDISRFRLGELGYSGVPMFNGVSQDELKRELNHPNSVRTYKLMSYHPTVNAPLSLYDMLVQQSTYRFIEPKDATAEEKRQTEIVESMFNDMEHSIKDFVLEAMSFTRHGWSTIEKVFRKRTYASGSEYNDGLIGIRKLPLRSQESITKFNYDDSGNDLLGMTQNISSLSDQYNRYVNRSESEIVLPRSKFMLFSLGSNRQNPYGVSPLRNVYTHWKYLQALEELEAQSVVKDVNGLPVAYIPAQYMSADASDDQKAIYEYFKNGLRNLQQGAQTAMMIPSFYDPDTRQPLFKLELLSQDGKKNFDLNKIKEYYRTMIFIGMGADVLLLGSTSAGSFALGSLKNTLTSNTAKTFLDRIIQVVNEDLIKQLYILNGWNPARRCKLDYDNMDEIDLESYSKAIQRMKSVAIIPPTLEVVNSALNALGIDSLPEGTTQEELDAMLGDSTSRSGDGMATAGDGTSTDPNKIDSNDSNSENVG